MPDNIYPDQSNDKFDIQYARLLGLSSDLQASIVTGETGVDSVIRTPDDDSSGFMRFGVAGEDDTAGENRVFDMAGYHFALNQLGNNHFLVDPGNGLYQLGAIPVPGSDSTLSYTYLEIDDTTNKITLQAPEGIVLPGYGYGNHSGTAAFNLAVDAGGNIIEVATGGGSVTADNGLSMSTATNVQLGQAVAAVGNPAILISHREIPMGGFTISFNASATQAANIFQTQNSSLLIRARITSAGNFSNTGGNTGSEQFGDGATTGTNTLGTAIGNGATLTGGGVGGLAIGKDATAINQAIAIGSGSLVTQTGSILIGSGTNSGINATVIGMSQGTISGGGATGMGYGLILTGLQSIGFGNGVSVGHQYSIVFGSESASTAANQFLVGAKGIGVSGVHDFYFGSGLTHATTANRLWTITGAEGSDISGTTLTIAGSKATGNAAGGDIIFSTSDAGASGTTLQTLTEKVRFLASGQIKIQSLAQDDTETKVVVWNSTDKILEWRDASTFGGGTDTNFAEDDLTATGNRTHVFGANTAEITYNSLAGASGFKLSSTSTAAASDNQKIFEVALSGANSNSAQDTYCIYASNTHTGTDSWNWGIWGNASGGDNNVGVRGNATGNAYGVWGSTDVGIGVLGTASGSGSVAMQGSNTATSGTAYGVWGLTQGTVTNGYAGYFSATNATNNYAIVVPSGEGRIGFGTTTPSAAALLELVSTTQAFIVMRMTATQASAITPAAGMVIFSTTTNGTFTAVGFWGYDGTNWTQF